MCSGRQNINNKEKRLSGGLAKLIEAATAVEIMSKELASAKVIVDAKQIDCQAMIEDIKQKSEIADKNKSIAEAKEEELTEMGKVIVEESTKANSALEEALPALEMAAEALNNLDKKDIGILVTKELRHRWKLFDKGDEINLPIILKQINEIDIVYYDSGKGYIPLCGFICLIKHLY